jgi:hypothetical protein
MQKMKTRSNKFKLLSDITNIIQKKFIENLNTQPKLKAGSKVALIVIASAFGPGVLDSKFKGPFFFKSQKPIYDISGVEKSSAINPN